MNMQCNEFKITDIHNGIQETKLQLIIILKSCLITRFILFTDNIKMVNIKVHLQVVEIMTVNNLGKKPTITPDSKEV